MNFLVALLASFLAVSAANPVGDIGGRTAALEARIVPKSCDVLPFLLCDGGINQEIACGHAWSCPGNGLHPVINNATCAAHNPIILCESVQRQVKKTRPLRAPYGRHGSFGLVVSAHDLCTMKIRTVNFAAEITERQQKI
ncbi:hypothetical protein C8J57DRAFT_1484489 [Mycena rebaudengoi]|nr:hypothetical protein C8J57DRAFT_1484489 [Mycena rebaudengoi]